MTPHEKLAHAKRLLAKHGPDSPKRKAEAEKAASARLRARLSSQVIANPCVHLGEATGERIGCGGSAAFLCGVHGKCTQTPCTQMACCTNGKTLCSHYKPIPQQPKLALEFPHGLGDCAQVAPLLACYVRRGWDVAVTTPKDKEIIFKLAGCRIAPGGPLHPFDHPPDFARPKPFPVWSGNKMAHAIGELPNLGDADAIWAEAIANPVRANRADFLQEIQTAEAFIADLPRPLVVTHTMGTNGPAMKNLPANRGLWERLLDAGCGVVELDWHGRSPKLTHPCFRKWSPSLAGLAGLYFVADLMIGVDSGPFHYSGLFDIPALGVFHGYYPSSFAIPQSQRACMVHQKYPATNRAKRKLWNLVEYASDMPTSDEIAASAMAMLHPRYLPDPKHAGREALLRHLVHDKSRLRFEDNWVDRWKTFDAALALKPRRILETGCQRQADDWGAGSSTLIFGLYVDAVGGELHSVDLSPEHCDLASKEAADLRGVTIHQGDSLAFLRSQTQADLIYLDSLDTYEAGHEEHCLAEAKIASGLTRAILIDDTPGKGKGAQAIPWLLSKGWRIAVRGYQCLLVR